MHKIVLIALLAFSIKVFAEGNFATNSPEVFVKNFTCSGGKATFNIVNKSSKSIDFVYVNIFDADGDPIDKKTITSYVEKNSGKADYANLDCNKLQRIGFSVKFLSF